MSFNTGAKLDPSQVEDVRGSRIGGRGLVVGGGGGIGIIVALVWVLLGGSPQTGETIGGLVGQTIGGGAGEPGPASSALAAECQTGADANASEDCRIVGYVNSIQAYWTDAFAASGQQYLLARTRFFTDQISTGCGIASSASGPFYCPGDQYVYIDLGFFDELRSTFGARGGPFAQAYILAHEYGHHVQDLVGTLSGGTSQGGRPGSRSGPSSRPTATRASGRATLPRRVIWCRSRRPRSPMRSMPRRPSATTGSSRSCRDRSTPRPGRTARPPSARSGSRPATRRGRRTAATRSAATPEARTDVVLAAPA